MIQKGLMIASAGLAVVFLIAILGRAHSTIVLVTPSNESIPFRDVEASFAPRISGSGITGVLYVAKPLNACVEIDNPAPQDRHYAPILLIERGECTFEKKVRIAQEAGYTAAVVYNNEEGEELVTMSGESVGIHINAIFVSKETADMLLQYADDIDTRCYILPAFENTAWSVLAVSFLSLLAVSAVLLTFFFVRRYRIRHISSRLLLNREAHGLSTREVKALPSVIFKSLEGSGTTDTCAICLEDYETGEKLRILPCHHGLSRSYLKPSAIQDKEVDSAPTVPEICNIQRKRLLNSNTNFHALCVDKWLTTRRAFCPICKQDTHSTSSVCPPSEHTPLLSSVSRPRLMTESSSIPIQTTVSIDTLTHTRSAPLYPTAYSLTPNQSQAASYMFIQDSDGPDNISHMSNTEVLHQSRTMSHQWSTDTNGTNLRNKNYSIAPNNTSSSDDSDALNSVSQGSDIC